MMLQRRIKVANKSFEATDGHGFSLIYFLTLFEKDLKKTHYELSIGNHHTRIRVSSVCICGQKIFLKKTNCCGLVVQTLVNKMPVQSLVRIHVLMNSRHYFVLKASLPPFLALSISPSASLAPTTKFASASASTIALSRDAASSTCKLPSMPMAACCSA